MCPSLVREEEVERWKKELSSRSLYDGRGRTHLVVPLMRVETITPGSRRRMPCLPWRCRLRAHLAVDIIARRTLLTLHPCLNLLELTLARQQLLSLLTDLTLHLELNLSEFLLLASKLLLFKPDRLRREILRVQGGISVFARVCQRLDRASR